MASNSYVKQPPKVTYEDFVYSMTDRPQYFAFFLKKACGIAWQQVSCPVRILQGSPYNEWRDSQRHDTLLSTAGKGLYYHITCTQSLLSAGHLGNGRDIEKCKRKRLNKNLFN